MTPRESAATKAGRYLVEGRLIVVEVSPGRVAATARGDGRLYDLGWQAGRWWCTCPARGEACSHLRALRRVVAVDLGEP